MKAEGWTEYHLGELLEVKHGYAFPGVGITDNPSKDVLVTPGNFGIGGGFKGDKLKYFIGEYPDEYLLEAGDIVVTMTDLSKQADTLGYPALVPHDTQKRFLHNQRIGKVQIKDNAPVDKGFLYYLLCTSGYRHEVLASASGSTVKHTSPKRIQAYKTAIPPLDVQREIASILKALDDKIDLNRRMNTTLEAMAQALFKEWFVDGAKEEWEVVTIEDATSLIIDHRGKTPLKLGSDWVPNGIPAVSAKNVKGGRLMRADSMNYVDEELYAKWMKEELEAGDTLLTSEAPLGELYYLSTKEKLCLSQRVYALRANSKRCLSSYLYMWLASEGCQAELQNRSTGSTVTGIRQSELRKTTVILPPLELQKEAAKLLDPCFLSIHNNEKESRTLASLRDTLLPKLMRGEVRVKETATTDA